MSEHDDVLRDQLASLAPDVDVEGDLARVRGAAGARRQRRTRTVALVSIGAALLVAAGAVAMVDARRAGPSSEITTAGQSPPPPPVVGTAPATTTVSSTTLPESPTTTVVTGQVSVALRPTAGTTTVQAGTTVQIDAVITNGLNVPIIFTTRCAERSVHVESPNAPPGTPAPAPVPGGWDGREGTLADYLGPSQLAMHNAGPGRGEPLPAGVANPETSRQCAADTQPATRSLAPGAVFTSRFVYETRLDATDLTTPTASFGTSFIYSSRADGTDPQTVHSAPLALRIIDGPAAVPDAAWLDAIDRLPEVRAFVERASVDATDVAIPLWLSYWDGAWELRLRGETSIVVRFSPSTGEVLEIRPA